jgi:hypothetical protein
VAQGSRLWFIILVVDSYVQEQVHTPLDTRICIVYAPISAGDSERFRFCIAATSKHAVGTLLSERKPWIVGELSISNRRVAEKFKS